MRVIRKAVFETNSSSAHTISFTSFDTNKLNLNIKDKILYIDLFDIDGTPVDFEMFKTSQEKLNYIASTVISHENGGCISKDKLNEILKSEIISEWIENLKEIFDIDDIKFEFKDNGCSNFDIDNDTIDIIRKDWLNIITNPTCIIIVRDNNIGIDYFSSEYIKIENN